MAELHRTTPTEVNDHRKGRRKGQSVKEIIMAGCYQELSGVLIYTVAGNTL
jgi:hypothetical protein